MKRNASKSVFFVFINYYYWITTITDILFILFMLKILSALKNNGRRMWRYEVTSPLTNKF